MTTETLLKANRLQAAISVLRDKPERGDIHYSVYAHRLAAEVRDRAMTELAAKLDHEQL